jgi:hypothetical protein
MAGEQPFAVPDLVEVDLEIIRIDIELPGEAHLGLPAFEP